ncbi:class I SAM-dependent methyltransferase [Desulfomarina sp.]
MIIDPMNSCFYSDFYTEHFQEYHDRTFTIDPSSFLSLLTRHLPEKATVLDVGCGSGRDLCWLSRRGYSVTGFERSPGLARLAGKNSGCPVIEGDYRNHDFSRMTFDAMLFIGSLVHLHPHELPRVLTNIIKGLKPEGFLLITLKEGRGRNTAGDGRIFTLWEPQNIETVFRLLGMKTVEFSRDISPICTDDIWLSYLTRS